MAEGAGLRAGPNRGAGRGLARGNRPQSRPKPSGRPGSGPRGPVSRPAQAGRQADQTGHARGGTRRGAAGDDPKPAVLRGDWRAQRVCRVKAELAGVHVGRGEVQGVESVHDGRRPRRTLRGTCTTDRKSVV